MEVFLGKHVYSAVSFKESLSLTMLTKTCKTEGINNSLDFCDSTSQTNKQSVFMHMFIQTISHVWLFNYLRLPHVQQGANPLRSHEITPFYRGCHVDHYLVSYVVFCELFVNLGSLPCPFVLDIKVLICLWYISPLFYRGCVLNFTYILYIL